MLDGVVSWLSIHAAAFLATGESPRPGSAALSGGFACYRVYRAGDGKYLTVGALEPQFWKALCDALGCPDLISDQFGPNQEEVADRLEDVFSTKTRDQWLAALKDVEACVAPVNDLAEALADPQVQARDMVADVEGSMVGPGSPLKLGARGPLRPAPGLGEHTAEVLARFGVDEDEIAALRAAGAI